MAWTGVGRSRHGLQVLAECNITCGGARNGLVSFRLGWYLQPSLLYCVGFGLVWAGIYTHTPRSPTFMQSVMVWSR